MSNGWPVVRLGDVLRHRKEFITIDDVTSYRRPRVQLHAQGIVLRDEVPGALIKTKKQQVCQAGEFLVAEIDAKVGGFGIVPDALGGAIVSSHYFLFGVDERKLNRRYLDYFIRTPVFREQVEAQGSTNYAAIRPAHVLGYMLPLPPLTEQRRVVARIEELAEQIGEARELRMRAVEEVSLLRLRFANDLFDSLKCETKALGDVALKKTGIAYRADDFNGSVGVPVVRLKEIQTKKPSVFLHNPDKYPNVWLEVGDIVLAKTSCSTVSMCQWPGPSAVLNQNAVMLRACEGMEQRFLFSWLGQQVNRYMSAHLADPNFYPYIRESDLVRWQVPVPSRNDQIELLAKLEAMQVEANSVERLQAETNAGIDALLPAILDRAFKGELV